MAGNAATPRGSSEHLPLARMFLFVSDAVATPMRRSTHSVQSAGAESLFQLRKRKRAQVIALACMSRKVLLMKTGRARHMGGSHRTRTIRSSWGNVS